MKPRLLFCILLAVACLLTSCGIFSAPVDETTAPETDASEPTGESTVFTEDETDKTSPEQTTEESTPPPTPGVIETVSLTWHRGYVASSTNINATSVLMDGATTYSYTDIFLVPYAGTKITFVDNSSASGSGGDGFASENAYVFSVWHQTEDGNWELDGSAKQFAGVQFADSVISAITGEKELTYTYVTARNNVALRLCYHSGERSGDRISYPTVTSEYTGETSTEELYRESNREIYDWIESTKADAYYSFLEGKTVNIIGDSYFAGQGLDKSFVWPGLIATKYGMTLVNHGIGGSTVSVTGDNKNPMVNRYQKLPDNNPDIVIIEGGRNDRSQNKLGKGAEIGSDNTTDPNTFKGALTAIIRGMKQKYPNALILCVTPWRVDDGTTEYGTAMKQVCVYEGVPCFDATNQTLSGVYMTSENFRAKYCMSATDVSHLNLEGMKLVMPAFEKFIAEEYRSFIGGGEQTEDTTVIPDDTTEAPTEDTTAIPTGDFSGDAYVEDKIWDFSFIQP